MANLFEGKNWDATKEALLEGLEGSKKSTMGVVLENTKQSLQEAASSGATNAGSIASLNKVILPVIRRVMPTVIANELVGVQPMTGPVGQIHTLRVRYAETVAAQSVNAGDEALSPFQIAAGYSGNASTSKADATSTLEGDGGRNMSIQIVKETVEAKSRKLAARWTFEAAQDAQAMHGVDIEAEILAALAQEITTEIDQEILASLMSLAGHSSAAYDQSTVAGSSNFTPTFLGDIHAVLAITMNEQANLIAARTRRGAANYAVVSPNVLTVLQSATTSAFARTTEGTFEAPTNVKLAGTLNNSMKVYVNTYAANDDVLLGYKGTTETDAAAFYCPYVPLMSSGVVMDPNTFEPTVSFMTRYGYKELTNTANSFGNAGDYVSKVAVSNLAFTQS
tara:strand:- start:585 stop:1766 length:1182 start_codon:yes stop_codon:yes gene_type:complete